MSFENFIFKYIGYLLGFLTIIVLSIIGYFVDKKDSSKKSIKNSKDDANGISSINSQDAIGDSLIKNSNENLSVSDSIPEVVSNGLGFSDFENFSQTDSSIDVSDVNSDNSELSFSNSNTVSSGLDLFGENNFENVNMSLDDLEKKNFDSFFNKNEISNDDENFYYSNMDDDFIDGVKLNDVKLEDSFSNDVSSNLTDVNNLNELSLSDNISGNNDLTDVSGKIMQDDNSSSIASNNNSNLAEASGFNESSLSDNISSDSNLNDVSDSLFSEPIQAVDSNKFFSDSIDNDSSVLNSSEIDAGNTSFDVDSSVTDDIWKF